MLNINLIIHEGLTLGEDILLDLAGQSEKLDTMSKTVTETQRTLKETKKVLKYFEKSLSTDKCVQCLICSIMLAILLFFLFNYTEIGDKIFTGGNSTNVTEVIPDVPLSEEMYWE